MNDNNDIFNDINKKINRISRIAEEIAPQVKKLLKTSITMSLVDWYNDYEPTVYKRTYNFMNNLSYRVSGRKNILTFIIDSGNMRPYKSFFDPNDGLTPSDAFDLMFMDGKHGQGEWMMHQSIPPYMIIEQDIEDGWNGQLDKIINKKLDELWK